MNKSRSSSGRAVMTPERLRDDGESGAAAGLGTAHTFYSSATSLLSPTSVRFSRVFLNLLIGAYDPT